MPSIFKLCYRHSEIIGSMLNFLNVSFGLSVTFLGHVVYKEGVMVDPAKIEAFHRRPRPTFSDRSLEIF